MVKGHAMQYHTERFWGEGTSKATDEAVAARLGKVHLRLWF